MKDASRKSWCAKACLALLASFAAVGVTEIVQAAAPPPGILLARGSSWKYNNSGTDLGTAWQAPAYNDTAWGGPSPGPLGDNNENGVQTCATVIDIGPVSARFPTVYFRRSFNVASPEVYSELILRLNRDDGAAVYLNGSLVMADNLAMPTSFNAWAIPPAVSGLDERTYSNFMSRRTRWSAV